MAFPVDSTTTLPPFGQAKLFETGSGRVVVHCPGISRFHYRLFRLNDDMSLCNSKGKFEKAEKGTQY